MTSFSSRPESDEDEPFIRRIMLETLADQLGASAWPPGVREPFLESQYRVRREGFRSSAAQPGAIVLVSGEPAAWYVISESNGKIHLLNLIVEKQHRGRGIGSAILRSLAASRKTLTLSVSRNNTRALDLYTRIGFRLNGDDGVHFSMERAAE